MLLSAFCMAVSLSVVPISAPPALGAPAVCHPFEIGSAVSLPWGEGALEVAPDYRCEHLVADALRVLDEHDDALVHMETLRRAVLYADRVQRELAGELVQALSARVIANELDAAGLEGSAVDPAASVKACGRAWFDLGYARAVMSHLGRRNGGTGVRELLRAEQLVGSDAAVQFGIAVGLWDLQAPGGGAGFMKHAGRALKGVEAAEGDAAERLRRSMLGLTSNLLGVRSLHALDSLVRKHGGA